MAHVQLLQIEIQNLKDALYASQKIANKYSQLVTTLSDELDQLRGNICHDCKKKFVPGIVLLTDPAPSLDLIGNASAATSSDLPPIDKIDSSIPSISLSTSETIPDTTVDTPVTNSVPEQTRISPKPEPLEFSVEYNPEGKRAIALHLDHVFAYKFPAFCVDISPDGQRMAVGFQDSGATIICDLKTRSNVRVFVDRYVKDKLLIRSVKFSHDGRLLATGATDHRIRIWDITQNRMRAMFKRHTHEVNSISFSPDGRSLVSASDDCSVRIWKMRDGSSTRLPVTDDARYFLSVVFSPDGRYIAAGNLRNSLSIWDSRTHKLLANWGAHFDYVWCVEFTPDGKGLMSGSIDKTFKYWDVSSLGNYEAISVRETVVPGHSLPLIRSFLGHTDTVYSIAFFPRHDGWVVTGAHDGVRVWDIRTGVWQLVMQGPRETVRGMGISRTENLLATASLDRQVTLWRYEML